MKLSQLAEFAKKTPLPWAFLSGYAVAAQQETCAAFAHLPHIPGVHPGTIMGKI